MQPSSSAQTFVESLEARVTPAVYFSDVPNGDPTIVDPSTVTYRDCDGDMVTVKFSKGIIDSQETLNSVFDFESVDIEGNLKGYDLKGISLEKFAGDAKLLRNLDISVSAETSTLNGIRTSLIDIGMDGPVGIKTDNITQEFGDGHVNVGSISGAGVDLGSVSIDGNLGKITAGDSKTSNGGLRSLTVESLGALGDAAEALAGDYTSVVNGALKNLDIAGNVSGALLKIQGGKHGDLLKAHIGGDILAGAIKAEGTIKTLVLDGSLVGTEGADTGLIYAADDIKALSIGGDLKGGAGTLSGSVAAGEGISKISIAGDLLGGAGAKSGSVASFEAKIGKVDHDGTATAGPGTDSGKFLSFINKQIKAERAHGAVKPDSGSYDQITYAAGYAAYMVYLQNSGSYNPAAWAALNAADIYAAIERGNSDSAIGDSIATVVTGDDAGEPVYGSWAKIWPVEGAPTPSPFWKIFPYGPVDLSTIVRNS